MVVTQQCQCTLQCSDDCLHAQIFMQDTIQTEEYRSSDEYHISVSNDEGYERFPSVPFYANSQLAQAMLEEDRLMRNALQPVYSPARSILSRRSIEDAEIISSSGLTTSSHYLSLSSQISHGHLLQPAKTNHRSALFAISPLLTITRQENYHRLTPYYTANVARTGARLETSLQETFGWYLYSLASEPYITILASTLAPILLEVLARHNAYQADHITPCQPQQGDQECVISIGSIWISTTVFPFCIMAIGLILQMLLILGLGGLVDRSIHHRRFLLVASLLGAMMSILTASVVSASMLVPATVVVIINCLFSGMFAVFYDAYLPILARLYLSHPRIKPHSNSTTMYHKIDRIYSLISGHGMAIGYASGALLLTSIIILIYRLDDVIYAMLLGCVIVGLWWFIISLIAHRLLSTRPNSMPLIGMNAWRCSTSQLVRMLYSVCKSSRTLLHLVACLLLSNAASTMWAIILVFGRKQFDIDYPQLMLIALATLIAASIGVYIWSAVQQCTGLTAHQMLILICGCYALLPVYGLAGFGTLIEFAHNTELQIMAAYHGLMLGAMQSYSRAVFVHLLSDGYENQYFSLYEVASKSMAWIGPLVVVLLMDQTRNHLYVFVGLLVAVLLAMLLAWKVDTSQTLAKLKTYVDAPIQHAIM